MGKNVIKRHTEYYCDVCNRPIDPEYRIKYIRTFTLDMVKGYPKIINKDKQYMCDRCYSMFLEYIHEKIYNK